MRCNLPGLAAISLAALVVVYCSGVELVREGAVHVGEVVDFGDGASWMWRGDTDSVVVMRNDDDNNAHYCKDCKTIPSGRYNVKLYDVEGSSHDLRTITVVNKLYKDHYDAFSAHPEIEYIYKAKEVPRQDLLVPLIFSVLLVMIGVIVLQNIHGHQQTMATLLSSVFLFATTCITIYNSQNQPRSLLVNVGLLSIYALSMKLHNHYVNINDGKGLLPALRSITDRVHLDSLQGESVAVDAYSWLHKAVYTCAADLFHHRPCRQHIDFCMQRLRQLLLHVKEVWLVFDGAELPAKRATDRERAQRRAEARLKAEELIMGGKLEEAAREMHKAIDVTPEMAHQFVEAIKRYYNQDKRVKWVVAPYEADAQLAYLEHRGLVTAVLSEDSDLVLFGVKRLCVKVDFRTGYFEMVMAERLQACRDLDLKGCTLTRFRLMCILSGCDYVCSVPGMGLKTANRYLNKYGTVERVCQVLRAEGRLVPCNYEQMVRRAELTFCHQRVWCPVRSQCVYLTPFVVGNVGEDDAFLGESMDDQTATDIANAVLHPTTRLPFQPIVNITVTGCDPENRQYNNNTTDNHRLTVKRMVPMPMVRKSTQKTIRDFFK